MGEVRRQTRAEAADILALQREIRQRVRANTAAFAAACAVRDFRRMVRVMDDTLTMIRYAAWLRRQFGYRVARLSLQPVPVYATSGRPHYRPTARGAVWTARARGWR